MARPFADHLKHEDLAVKFAAMGPLTIHDIQQEAQLNSNASAHHLLSKCRRIPWSTVERLRRGLYQFTIDEELRRQVTQKPELGGHSESEVVAFLANLRQEITRRRKEANARRNVRKWHSDLMIKAELTGLVDWIEAELDKLNPVSNTVNTPVQEPSQLPRILRHKGKEDTYDHEEIV